MATTNRERVGLALDLLKAGLTAIHSPGVYRPL